MTVPRRGISLIHLPPNSHEDDITFSVGNPCELFLCHCDSGRGDNPINTHLKMNGRNLKIT